MLIDFGGDAMEELKSLPLPSLLVFAPCAEPLELSPGVAELPGVEPDPFSPFAGSGLAALEACREGSLEVTPPWMMASVVTANPFVACV